MMMCDLPQDSDPLHTREFLLFPYKWILSVQSNLCGQKLLALFFIFHSLQSSSLFPSLQLCPNNFFFFSSCPVNLPSHRSPRWSCPSVSWFSIPQKWWYGVVDRDHERTFFMGCSLVRWKGYMSVRYWAQFYTFIRKQIKKKNQTSPVSLITWINSFYLILFHKICGMVPVIFPWTWHFLIPTYWWCEASTHRPSSWKLKVMKIKNIRDQAAIAIKW